VAAGAVQAVAGSRRTAAVGAVDEVAAVADEAATVRAAAPAVDAAAAAGAEETGSGSEVCPPQGCARFDVRAANCYTNDVVIDAFCEGCDHGIPRGVSRAFFGRIGAGETRADAGTIRRPTITGQSGVRPDVKEAFSYAGKLEDRR